jgi:hypothetical protein
MTVLQEDLVFLSVKSYLRDHGWQILGGEPPDGTNDIIRIAIRPKVGKGRLHSLGAQKVDLISRKGSTILLTEVKPEFSDSDRRKLDKILDEKLPALKDALWERCKIPPEDVKEVVKSLGFSVGSPSRLHDDFVHFEVHKDGSVRVKKGKANLGLDV